MKNNTILQTFSLTQSIKNLLRPIKHFIRRIQYSGTQRYCPICKRSYSKFLSYKFGVNVGEDSVCPVCGCLGKHRFIYQYFEEKTNLFDNPEKDILHIAPESSIRNKFLDFFGSGYITADLYMPNVMVKMDISDIQYPDQTFDVIFASHVVEYVADDRKAMRELYRVLKPNGWVALMTKIWLQPTLESDHVPDAQERLRIFGDDKIFVRQYGPDFVDRLTEAGFLVTVIKPEEIFTLDDRVYMGINNAGEIYYCTKPQSN